jgi:hypothetical protein
MEVVVETCKIGETDLFMCGSHTAFIASLEDQLAKGGSLYPFVGPDRVAERTIRDWMCREHQQY